VLVVAREASVQHVQAVGLLDAPADGLGDEPGAGRVALDDLNVDSECSAVVDHAGLEALVRQRRTHGAGGRDDLVQQRGADRVVVHRRRDDHDRDDQPYDVDGQPAPPSRGLLGRVQASGGLRHPGCRAHRLRVEHNQERVRRAAGPLCNTSVIRASSLSRFQASK
jgi:hypothetical protein